MEHNTIDDPYEYDKWSRRLFVVIVLVIIVVVIIVVVHSNGIEAAAIVFLVI